MGGRRDLIGCFYLWSVSGTRGPAVIGGGSFRQIQRVELVPDLVCEDPS